MGRRTKSRVDDNRNLFAHPPGGSEMDGRMWLARGVSGLFGLSHGGIVPSYALIVRDFRMEVQESAIVRWLNRLGSSAMSEVTTRVEHQKDRFFAEALNRMGQGTSSGLEPTQMVLPLPPEISSARIEAGELSPLAVRANRTGTRFLVSGNEASARFYTREGGARARPRLSKTSPATRAASTAS